MCEIKFLARLTFKKKFSCSFIDPVVLNAFIADLKKCSCSNRKRKVEKIILVHLKLNDLAFQYFKTHKILSEFYLEFF